VDHILTFSILDNKIWFRNFQVRGRAEGWNGVSEPAAFTQIMEKDPMQPNGPPQTSLVEIGPRFVLTPIRIFEGAFGGATVFSNPGKFMIMKLLQFIGSLHFRICITCGSALSAQERGRAEVWCSEGCRGGALQEKNGSLSRGGRVGCFQSFLIAVVSTARCLRYIQLPEFSLMHGG
jgi:hypothetical protein